MDPLENMVNRPSRQISRWIAAGMTTLVMSGCIDAEDIPDVPFFGDDEVIPEELVVEQKELDLQLSFDYDISFPTSLEPLERVPQRDRDESEADKDLISEFGSFHIGGSRGGIEDLDFLRRDFEHSGVEVGISYDKLFENIYAFSDATGRFLNYKGELGGEATELGLEAGVVVPIFGDLDNGLGVELSADFSRFTERFLTEKSQNIVRPSLGISYLNATDNDIFLLSLLGMGELIDNPGNTRLNYGFGGRARVLWADIGGSSLSLTGKGKLFYKLGGDDVERYGAEFNNGLLIDADLGLSVGVSDDFDIGLRLGYLNSSGEFTVGGVPDETLSDGLGLSLVGTYTPK